MKHKIEVLKVLIGLPGILVILLWYYRTDSRFREKVKAGKTVEAFKAQGMTEDNPKFVKLLKHTAGLFWLTLAFLIKLIWF